MVNGSSCAATRCSFKSIKHYTQKIVGDLKWYTVNMYKLIVNSGRLNRLT